MKTIVIKKKIIIKSCDKCNFINMCPDCTTLNEAQLDKISDYIADKCVEFHNIPQA